MAGSSSIGNPYPNQFVDYQGNPTQKKVYTDPLQGNNSPFYYTPVPSPEAQAATKALTSGGGGGGGTQPGGGGGTMKPQGRAPAMKAPAQVPPINVNSILQQWKSIQTPMLPREPEIPFIDETAAAQAAYGRAKDTAGNQGRAAMDALMDVQGARGVVGSGMGVGEAGDVLGAVNQNLSDVNREQLIQSYATELDRQKSNAGLRVTQRGQDIDQVGLNQSLLPMLTNLFGKRQDGLLQQRGQDVDLAQTNYQGGITQRGQDMDFTTAQGAQANTRRGQDIDILAALKRMAY